MNLESNLSQWHIFHDHGYTEGSLQGFGNTAGYTILETTLMNGTQNYANILAYRDLPAADTATIFSMDVSFLYQQVHYIGFYCDTLYTDIHQLTFDPIASPGDKLSVGVQIDGNYQETAYSVFYHDINFYYL